MSEKARFWLLLGLCVFQYLVLARTTHARVVRELRTSAWMAPSAVVVGLGMIAGRFGLSSCSR